VGAQEWLGVAALGRLEHAPDRGVVDGRRGLLPAVAVGDLAQLGELAVAEGQHVGKRSGQRPPGSRRLAGVASGDDHLPALAAELDSVGDLGVWLTAVTLGASLAVT